MHGLVQEGNTLHFKALAMNSFEVLLMHTQQ